MPDTKRPSLHVYSRGLFGPQCCLEAKGCIAALGLADSLLGSGAESAGCGCLLSSVQHAAVALRSIRASCTSLRPLTGTELPISRVGQTCLWCVVCSPGTATGSDGGLMALWMTL